MKFHNELRSLSTRIDKFSFINLLKDKIIQELAEESGEITAKANNGDAFELSNLKNVLETIIRLQERSYETLSKRGNNPMYHFAEIERLAARGIEYTKEYIDELKDDDKYLQKIFNKFNILTKKYAIDYNKEQFEKVLEIRNEILKVFRSYNSEFKKLEKAFRLKSVPSSEWELVERINININENKIYRGDFDKKFDFLLKKYNNIIIDFEKEIYNLQNKIAIENIKEGRTDFLLQSDIFIHNKNSNDLKKFIENKSSILTSIELPENYAISAFYIMRDNSFVVKNKGIYKTVSSKEELENLKDNMELNCLSHILRKKPKIAKFFTDKYKEDKRTRSISESVTSSYYQAQITALNFLENEQILKNENFSLSVFTDKSFEEIDDEINEKVYDFKIKKYAESILSSKYKHLLTEKSMPYFKQLNHLKFTEEDLQNFVGKKLARIKTSDEFCEFMKNVLNSMSGFNYEAITLKSKKLNIDEISYENGILILEIKDFEQSKEIGSPSWCLTRDQYYFNKYTSNGARQFFIYDFNKQETENDSMIGLTIEKNGYNHTQHLKNDDYLNYDTSDYLSQKSVLSKCHKIILDKSFNYEDVDNTYLNSETIALKNTRKEKLSI